jgi:hypothetical protein
MGLAGVRRAPKPLSPPEPQKAIARHPWFNLATFDLAKLDRAKLDLAKFDPAKFDAPKFDTPRLATPRFDTPRLNGQRLNGPRFDAPIRFRVFPYEISLTPKACPLVKKGKLCN